MTSRLYYTDSLLATFDAHVVSCDQVDGRAEVVLDQTAFYPTSGGQPFDTGQLNGARVVEVRDRDDGEIVHIVETPLAVETAVHGDIDWARRFDHMQQHTGQHILSAAFDRLHGVRTESFHLGAETSTIDLARDVTPAEAAAAEREASQVVWEDRPVTVRFASEEDANRLPLRKEPVRTGELRLVEVTGFDLSACGGTHVPRTGMIGVIAITGCERVRGGSRVGFVCGGRALAAWDALRDQMAASSRVLSVAASDLPGALERLKGDLKEAHRAAHQFQEEVAGHRAATLRAAAETIGGRRVVLRHEPGWDPSALRTLAAAIVAEPDVLAVLVGGGEPAPVVVARSADVNFDARAWLARAAEALGGRGGGRPELAQGGLGAGADRILALARDTLG
jgi:alanyl-tRNA synthetase